MGNVEGQRLGRRAAAGILHVVHFAGHGAARLARLQGHSGLALNLETSYYGFAGGGGGGAPFPGPMPMPPMPR